MIAHPKTLPIKCNLSSIYILSLIIAILMAVTSAAGLMYRAIVYPTDELVRAFVPNDVVNLFIGLPILLGSTWLAWRGKLIGLLCLPGALFFVVYNYIAYVFAMPLNFAFILHLVLVALSVYTIIALVASIDANAVQRRLAGAVPERAAGGVLIGLGFFILLRVIGVLSNAIYSQTLVAETELAVNISDFLSTPAWIVGGVMLRQRKALGYVAGLGLLFQFSMLFIALIVFLILRPLLTTMPFVLADVIVIAIMGSICFIPFILFARGVASRQRPVEQ